MGVVFDEVIANVETPVDRPPADTPPAATVGGSNKKHEIIDAVETQQRRALRLQAD
jgi:hypothetical protein